MFKNSIVVLSERRGWVVSKIAQVRQLFHGDVIEVFDEQTEEPRRHASGTSWICTSNPRNEDGEWTIDVVPVKEAADAFGEAGDGGTFVVDTAQKTGTLTAGDQMSDGNVWDEVPFLNRG